MSRSTDDFIFGVFMSPIIYTAMALIIFGIYTLINGPEPIKIKAKPEQVQVIEKTDWKKDYQNHMTIYKAYFSCISRKEADK
jgi:hypothetical protein